MTVIVKRVFYFGPLIFAIGFLTPLIAQTLTRLDIQPPLGMTPLAAGFLVAGALGLIAQIRGRWL